MNNNINIAEILKDCPKGTKLYSPLFGNVTLESINSYSTNTTIEVKDVHNSYYCFYKTGVYYDRDGAECLLFPSSGMRDWSKFFKRGDVVRNIDTRTLAVFKGWKNNDYTSFYASIVHHAKVNKWDEDIVLAVESFYKEPKEFVRGFTADAEEHYNGKYNPETLQIEPVKPVKVEYSFKPFDKVLVRDDIHERWRISIFSNYLEKGGYPYACMNGVYRYCIPYNEQTTHLVDTNKPYNP